MSDVNLSNIYHRINSKGLLEAVDILTGRIVAVQHDMSEFSDPTDPKYTKVTDLNGNTVYVARELVVKGQTPFEKTNAYSSFFADLLVQKIVEGWSIHKACAEIGLEYSVYNKWRAENSEFEKRIQLALKDRATLQVEEILEIADESKDAKLQIEARGKVASFYDEKFSAKTTIKGDKSAPLQFTIISGIPPQDPIDITPQTEAPGHLPAPDPISEAEEVASPVGLLKDSE